MGIRSFVLASGITAVRIHRSEIVKSPSLKIFKTVYVCVHIIMYIAKRSTINFYSVQ